MNEIRFSPALVAEELKTRIPDISFALLFGSAREGLIRSGSDLDLAVYHGGPGAPDARFVEETTGLVERVIPGCECDLTILNNAGVMVAFEALKGKLLFVRPEARDLYADFFSLTARQYGEAVWWMNTQLRYRGYEV